MRDRVTDGELLGEAIHRFEQRLRKRGLAAFDPKDEVQRNRAICACVEASLEDLDGNELARLCELAIFPDPQVRSKSGAADPGSCRRHGYGACGDYTVELEPWPKLPGFGKRQRGPII